MRSAITTLDRYVVRQTAGILFAVLGIVMSLMMLEHLPRLIEISRLSGHRGEIVVRTLGGLVPEYGGIGLLVGLYLAIALAVRKLALRGELDVIEAAGIGPLRWMRMPLVLSAAIALTTLFNQGWLVPQGERRLADIVQRMDAGEFGFSVQPDEMIDLGDGNALTFGAVSNDGTYLRNVFLAEQGTTYAAASGHIAMGPQGGVTISLFEGQSVQADDHRVARFHRLDFFEQGQPVIDKSELPSGALKTTSLPDLLAARSPEARAAAYGRVLWAVLAMLTPALALALGRPPRRSASALSLLLGLLVIVGLLKSISLVESHPGRLPELAAIALAAFWLACVAALVRWIRHAGAGAFDELVFRLTRRRSRTKHAGPFVRRGQSPG